MAATVRGCLGAIYSIFEILLTRDVWPDLVFTYKNTKNYLRVFYTLYFSGHKRKVGNQKKPKQISVVGPNRKRRIVVLWDTLIFFFVKRLVFNRPPTSSKLIKIFYNKSKSQSRSSNRICTWQIFAVSLNCSWVGRNTSICVWETIAK